MAEKIYPTRRLKTHETYSKEFDGVSSNIKKKDASTFHHSHIRGNLSLSKGIFKVLTVLSKNMRLKKQPETKSTLFYQ